MVCDFKKGVVLKSMNVQTQVLEFEESFELCLRRFLVPRHIGCGYAERKGRMNLAANFYTCGCALDALVQALFATPLRRFQCGRTLVSCKCFLKLSVWRCVSWIWLSASPTRSRLRYLRPTSTTRRLSAKKTKHKEKDGRQA